MNIQKLIAIAAAIAINVLVLAWFHLWSANAIASAAPPAHTDPIVTLPVIHVTPSAAQLRKLHDERATKLPQQADAVDVTACIAMPYYSFAGPCVAAVSG